MFHFDLEACLNFKWYNYQYKNIMLKESIFHAYLVASQLLEKLTKEASPQLLFIQLKISKTITIILLKTKHENLVVKHA